MSVTAAIGITELQDARILSVGSYRLISIGGLNQSKLAPAMHETACFATSFSAYVLNF